MFWTLTGVLFVAMLIVVTVALSGSLLNVCVRECKPMATYTGNLMPSNTPDRDYAVHYDWCGNEEGSGRTLFCGQSFGDKCIDKEKHQCCPKDDNNRIRALNSICCELPAEVASNCPE